MRRGIVLTLALALVAGLLGACRSSPTPPAGELRVEGTAEVARDSAPLRPVTTSPTLVPPGATVRLVTGSATLSLGGGRQLELREGTVVHVSGSPGDPFLADVVRGEVLVSSEVAPAQVTAAGTEVDVRGVGRVSRGLAVVVGVYQGSARLRSVGSTLDVPALRQVSIAARGLLPARPSPLSLAPGDPWDRRFLAEAIELGDQLVARSRGLTNGLPPGEGTTPGFYRLLLPDLEREPGFGAALLRRQRPPGENLVGATIALAGDRGTFEQRWRQVFAFHDEGATWGMVALDQGVRQVPLLAQVERALGRAGDLAAPPPPPPASPPPGGTGNGSGNGAGNGGGSPGGPPPPAISPPDGGTPPGPGVPLERTITSRLGIPLVDDTVESLVDALGGLLRGLSTP